MNTLDSLLARGSWPLNDPHEHTHRLAPVVLLSACEGQYPLSSN
jgi:hypothetical protein